MTTAMPSAANKIATGLLFFNHIGLIQYPSPSNLQQVAHVLF